MDGTQTMFEFLCHKTFLFLYIPCPHSHPLYVCACVYVCCLPSHIYIFLRLFTMQVWLVSKLGGGCRIVAHNILCTAHFPDSIVTHTCTQSITQKWIGMFCTNTCSVCCCLSLCCGCRRHRRPHNIPSSYMRGWRLYIRVFASARIFAFHSFSQRRCSCRCQCRCRRSILLDFPFSYSVGDFQSIGLDGFLQKCISLFDKIRIHSLSLFEYTTSSGTCCFCVLFVRLSTYMPSNSHSLLIIRNALSKILIGHWYNSKVFFTVFGFTFLRSNTFHKCQFCVLGWQYNCSIAWMFHWNCYFATICLWIWKAADWFLCTLLV